MISELYIFMDVFIASILTMLIGIERERADKAAGIRTNMIVGGFTCLVVAIIKPLTNFLQEYFKVAQHSSGMVEIDPIRIVQAIVIGVSFIGAGTIIKSREDQTITGLTTAATLLYSAGIGICVAIKMYLLAVCLTVFVLVINKTVNYLAKKYTSVKD
ncbi:MgtC/SapB family protein [Limibacter armeniacum]|uniref:MgtC/SapB family protein n=1 Tax=Limibacter armeniacum TaxID=466084 RepID=UPI002FE65414